MAGSEKAILLRTIGAKVYYRDSVDGRFVYVLGQVTDFKDVRKATTEWQQHWKHNQGTILEIWPLQTVDEMRKKYRHLSSVLTTDQYEARRTQVA